MQTGLLLALALVVRSLPSVDGAVDFVPGPGQDIVAAYSADFESVWHHAVPTTVVERLESARSGRVTGLGPSTRLVVALSDGNAEFDASHPLKGDQNVFPYSSDLVRAYEKATNRSYVRDMMVVAVPLLGSQDGRAIAVAELYETLFGLKGGSADEVRTEGSGAAGSVLVVTGRARTWSWLERCSGDDGADYAKRLAEKGYRVDRGDRSVFARLAIDRDGFVVRDGRRYGTMVVRHFSRRDAEAFRHTFGTRPLKTKIYATDTPVLYGTELTLSDPELRRL